MIPTSVVFTGAFLMAVARFGSLNALEQDKRNPFWRRRLGAGLPSADTVGRVFAQLDQAGLRRLLHGLYDRLKRNKALDGTVLILDGHETTASYLRCCPGCLERKMQDGRIQYYHRVVLAMLVGGCLPFLLDMEPQQKGEDEVACALRLLGRVLQDFPRAFDLVVADGLYLGAPFVRFVLRHGKDAVIVLKDERRDLLQDARGIFRLEPPTVEIEGSIVRRMWDVDGLTSWTAMDVPIRVVRSLETRTVLRQRTKTPETTTSDWIWATTLSSKKASTRTVIDYGHDRWLIENKGFREMGTFWHADHIYRHDAGAITAFLLTLMVALNLFRAFVQLNIKPVLRERHTQLYFAQRLTAELLVGPTIPP
ncbi:MAG: transposase [Candidatus Aminicenantes bacterium]|nr:transposase [Candidatus Aminicenantes bacterium]